jgi:chromosome segregation ATPase
LRYFPYLPKVLQHSENEASMTRLEQAAARFAAALEQVEKAGGPLAKAREEMGRTATRIAELTAERERLLARIAELEDEARTLSGLTHEVQGRLDGAIAEIRAALGRA